jgi:putative tricarboxylic transport membrane protein
MEFINHLLLGVSTAFTTTNLVMCLAGVILGTLVGVLPGLGPLAAISILLPLSHGHGDAITAIIFMAGVFYGTQYGGSTTSILMNLPGESTSVVTTLDGYQMTRNGRSGAALAIAAWSSFFAGTVATVLIALLGVPLAEIAFLFGPTEYTALMILGLVGCVWLSQGPLLLALAMTLLGILFGLVGTDVNSGMVRFHLDVPNLVDGINFGIIAMGMFGLSEIMYTWLHDRRGSIHVPRFRELYPTREETKKSLWPTLRGTTVGSILGMIPGGGAVIASFASYAVEKKISRTPSDFGKGAVEGVAAPEAANNAGAQTSFIPMLSLGLPFTPIMALMLGVLIMHDIQPGPQVINANPDLFWGLIVSMWIGNVFLLILNLPLVGVWVSILKLPWKFLYPAVILICVFGAYSLSNSWVDVLLLIPFTLLGYIFKTLGCPLAPLAMGFVIGKMFEEYFRRSLIISDGNLMTFIERPISAAFLLITVLIVTAAIFWKGNKSTSV